LGYLEKMGVLMQRTIRGEIKRSGRNKEPAKERTQKRSTQFKCHEPFTVPIQNGSEG
jgi:hypothetical protein